MKRDRLCLKHFQTCPSPVIKGGIGLKSCPLFLALATRSAGIEGDLDSLDTPQGTFKTSSQPPCFGLRKNQNCKSMETKIVGLDALKQEIEPLRQSLFEHPLYTHLQSLLDIRIFMGFHVFAVWDFMSLLKRLQADLTCIQLPWVPVGDAEVRFLINEIVCGEESDVDPRGSHISHFELYLRAMRETGASTAAIEQVVRAVGQGQDYQRALSDQALPQGAAQFCLQTLELASTAPIHCVAAAFTCGREDVIPDLFLRLVKKLNVFHNESLATFCYYLERHIEVDAGHHGHVARRMLELLCGDDQAKWAAAVATAKQTLHARLRLWDAVLQQLNSSLVKSVY